MTTTVSVNSCEYSPAGREGTEPYRRAPTGRQSGRVPGRNIRSQPAQQPGLGHRAAQPLFLHRPEEGRWWVADRQLSLAGCKVATSRATGRHGGAAGDPVHPGGPSEPRQRRPAPSPSIRAGSRAATADLDVPTDHAQTLHHRHRIPGGKLQPDTLRQGAGHAVGITGGNNALVLNNYAHPEPSGHQPTGETWPGRPPGAPGAAYWGLLSR